MQPNLRYLACLRLSSDSDESTAIVRQRRGINHYVNAPHVAGTIVGEAEDTDVSGGLSPFQRPKLGRWLNHRYDEFDVLIASKLDRFTRRALHFNELLKWCQDRGKFIVCVEEGFDLSTGPGKMMAQITAVFAEAEWDTIQARILNGVQTRLENKSWLVGAAPAGYKIIPVEGERRKIIDREESYWPVIEEIKTRIKEKKQTTHKIAKEFNEKKILTWSDHQRVLKGQEPKGIMWQATIINKMVRSNWFAGIYTYKGEAVLDDTGEPYIMPKKPHATMDEWFDLVDRIAPAEKEEGETETRSAKSLLAGVAKCGECGAALARVPTSGAKRKDGTRAPSKHFYRCTNRFRGGTCTKGAYIECEELDKVAEDIIVSSVGQWEMYERSGAGPSNQKALEAAEARLTKLEADFLEGKYDGEGQEESYWRMHKALSGKVQGLKKAEEERKKPEIKATGRKYAQDWAEKDEHDRRDFLREYKVTMWVWRDCLPNMTRGNRSGAVLDLGEIGRIAEELKLVMPEQVDWLWHGWNVPQHWASPHLLDDPEFREQMEKTYGSAELPKVLQDRLDKYKKEREEREAAEKAA
ncbi:MULTISPECIES: recombinase family protein [Streptomyces]|uniref:recombinase family protein n=1 Tax=Streptomyces TaxID=1883 RepID=UPI001E63D93B|nr:MULTISPECIES: recombinase family protein [Streptomyces]UFQ16461.1 recombinase family protein [Streptomyces huasconensis]WCL86063.1 recombinase family protein [Streptomyces sp. JCM 35825]